MTTTVLRPWQGVKLARAMVAGWRHSRRERLAELQAQRWPERAIEAAAMARRRRWIEVRPPLTPYSPGGQ